MNAKKLSKRILEGMLIGATLFGNLKDVSAPEIIDEIKEQRSEYFSTYLNKMKKRDAELAKYAQFIGKPLIDEWVQNAIDRIKPHELIDVNYVLATGKQESKFKPYAVSFVGASGIMQVMPETWEGIERDNSFYKDRFNPDRNLEVGIKVLDSMAKFCEKNYPGWDDLSKEEKIKLVSASYNGGNGHLMKKNWDINKMEEETKKYVPNILKYYKEFSLSD